MDKKSGVTPDVYTVDDRAVGLGGLVRLKVWHDDSADEPGADDDGAWNVYSFESNIRGSVDRSTFDDGAGNVNIGLRRKLQVGLAFMLDRRGQDLRIVHSGDDLESAAGLMVWEREPGDMGAKTYEARREDAQGGLDEYNAWADGQCWGYTLREGSGREIDKVWTLYGDYIKTEVGNRLGYEAKRRGLARVAFVNKDGYKKLGAGAWRADTLYVIVSGVGAYLFT